MEKLSSTIGQVDELICYLVLEGYSDEIINDVIENGIEIFVSSWEESVEWIVKTPDDTEEYDHDIYPRTELFFVMQYASPEQIDPFKDRIEKADSMFRMATKEHAEFIRHMDKPDRAKHWWLFRYSS